MNAPLDVAETIKKYILEVIEALVSILVVGLVTRNRFGNWNIIGLAFLIGTITFSIEYYDKEFQKMVKRGMVMSVGGSLLPR